MNESRDLLTPLAGGVPLNPDEKPVDSSITELAHELAKLWELDLGFVPPAEVFFAADGWDEPH